MKSTQTPGSTARNVRTDSFVAQMERSERAALGAAIERVDMAELERKAITARIKQARIEAGLSQPEMAEALHTHERTYQNYESQKHPRVPWGLMNEIAKITGKSTEWLIHGDAATPDILATFNGDMPDDLLEQLADLHRKLDTIIDALGLEETADVHPLQQINDLAAALPELLARDAGTAGASETQ